MKKYPAGYKYGDILKMDYLLYLDHLYYLDCIEAEDNLTLMRMMDNNLWLQSNIESSRKNYNKLYSYFESIVKKVKEIKTINVFNEKRYDDFFKRYKTPKKRGDKNSGKTSL